MTEVSERKERVGQVQAERRRRRDDTIDGSQKLKLAIPPDVEKRLKEEGRTPRWVIKDSRRMFQLTQQDDYDPVDGVEPVTTRNLSDGAQVQMILLSKPTAFIDEDKAKKDAPRRELEKSFLRGRVPGNPADTGNTTYSETYVDPASKITHGGLGPP
jgi:hypothetical protein